MPWIESHTELVHHPKLLHLSTITGWSANECIGTLHRLWWWALAYAEDGRLGKYKQGAISGAVGAQITDQYSHEKFFEVMIEAEFIDKDLKIHDWWDYAGKYITSKYRNNHPEIIIKIQKLYKKAKGQSKGQPITSQENHHIPTYLPTYINKPTNQNLECALEEIIIDCKNKDKITALILSDTFLEQYVVWSLYRKDELKKKLTKSGIKGQIDKLALHGPDIAILMIQKSIENGWTGIFDLKDHEKPGYQKPQTQKESGMSYEEKKDITRRLHSDLSDAKQDLQSANDELEFNKKPTSEQRVQDAQRKVNKLRKELDI